MVLLPRLSRKAFASFLVSALVEPQQKKPLERDGLSLEHKKLVEVLTNVFDDRMGQQAEKIDRELGAMAQATDQQFSNLRKEIDVEKKAQMALQEEVRKEFNEIKNQASRRVNSMPPNVRDPNFAPSYLDVKGWCEYAEPEGHHQA